MSVRKNPPSFILVDKSTGEVVYTKRATGVGSEAITKCVERGRALAAKTGKTYFVYLDIMGVRVGMKISVPMAYSLGITEEVGPQGSAMPSGHKCCSAPDVRPSGQGMRCFNCQRWESDNYLKNPRGRKRTKPIVGRPDALPWEQLSDVEQAEIAHQYEGRGADIMKLIARGARFIKRYGGWEYRLNNPGRVRRNIFTFNNPPSGPADPTAARELELYIDNDSQLYHSQFIPIVKNLMLKRRNGVYNRELAVKLFMYLMDAGAKKYVAEFGTRGQKIDSMFNRNTRLQAARAFRDSFETEAELGNYDRLIGPVSNPSHNRLIRCVCGRTISRESDVVNEAGDMECPKCGQWYNAFGQRLKDPSKWEENPRRGVRKNIFTFNNPKLKFSDLSIGEKFVFASEHDPRFLTSGMAKGPWIKNSSRTYEHADDVGKPISQRRYGGGRISVGSINVGVVRVAGSNPRKLNQIEQAAAEVGLYVTTWAPGDGVTRYRFHRGPADYNDGSGIYTALGRADAMNFIKAFGMGKSKKNPLTRREVSQIVTRAKDVARTATSMRDLGEPARMRAHIAYGRGTLDTAHTYAVDGARKGVRKMLSRFNRIDPRESSRSNPVCSNPVIRGDKLPRHLQEEVLRTFIYRWTTDNTQREHAWRNLEKPRIPLITDAQWLREHAFHVTKAGKLDVRHAHAEPHYMADDWKKGDPLPNPLLQTVFAAANPPISAQWDTMTRRQRLAVMEVAGYEGSYAVNRSWATLDPSMRRNIEQLWLDTSSRGGTTRRRRAVAVNPLTRKESASVIKSARFDLKYGSAFAPGHTRSRSAGMAYGRARTVEQFGPRAARKAALKVENRAVELTHGVRTNPGTLRLPKPGTKMTVAQALELARRIGDKSLIAQCHQAMKLQKKANKGAKCVIWKTLAIGSPNKIDTVVALTHYGDSPETMYRPPKGSKKGPHMYRHKWGEGGGAKKTVPLLASADGKALLMPLDGKKIASDWLRH